MPFAGYWPDHRSRIDLATINAHRAAEASSDVECRLNNSVAREARHDGLEIRDLPGRAAADHSVRSILVSGHPQDGPLCGTKRSGLHLSGRLNRVLAITLATTRALSRRRIGWRFNHDPSAAEPNLPCRRRAA